MRAPLATAMISAVTLLRRVDRGGGRLPGAAGGQCATSGRPALVEGTVRSAATICRRAHSSHTAPLNLAPQRDSTVP